jgi:hypothetical protein
LSPISILDDFPGFEFEDLVEEVFRNPSYENVWRAERMVNEGERHHRRGIDGTQRMIIVGRKNTGTVD